MTVPTTVLTTVTQVDTSIDTVVVAIVETSTVISTVDVTVTSAGATQTDWVYVTATAVEKRSLHAGPTAAPEPAYEGQPRRVGLWESLRHTCDGILVAWGFLEEQDRQSVQAQVVHPAQATLRRRQQQPTPGGQSPLQETTTIFPTITQASTVVSDVHSTVTTQTTSVVTTTITQTNTK